jgi:hypothetical protein
MIVTFNIKKYSLEMRHASSLIKKCIKINKLHIKSVKINLDFNHYNRRELGHYFYNSLNKYQVTIYPFNCAPYNSDIEQGVISSFNDYSLFNAIIHEFSHMLLETKYKSLFNSYKHETRGRSIVINSNSSTNKLEECVEVITLYIINPYLLKLISNKAFLFCKQCFNSPTKVSKKNFVNFFHKLSQTDRRQLKDNFNIIEENI